MLRSRAMIGTLNVTPTQRLSVALVYLTFLGLSSRPRWPTMVITAATRL